MASEAADALDPTLARTGYRGERNKVVLHHDVDADGTLGPGQLHLGAVVPDTVARFLGCDAEVIVAAYRAGQLIGITPTTRTVPRHLRRVIERRDQGCAHPLCTQTRWLHIHHIVYWAPPRAHRARRTSSASVPPTIGSSTRASAIDGNPEDGTLRFLDRHGTPIEPPDRGPPTALRLDEPSPFTPPYGERLDPLWFTWN